MCYGFIKKQNRSMRKMSTYKHRILVKLRKVTQSASKVPEIYF